jgi:hypothetical protein
MAMAHGSRANRIQVHEHKWTGREHDSSPERPAPPQVAKEVPAEQRLLGDSRLDEEARDQRHPAWVHRHGAARGERVHRHHKPEQGGHAEGGHEATASRAPEPADAARERLAQSPSLEQQRRRDDQSADREPGLSAVAAEPLRHRIEHCVGKG